MATREQVKRAIELFGDEIEGKREVVGLGITPAEDDGGTGGMAVAVYVRRLPSGRLPAEERIPEVVRIPGMGGEREIPIRIIEQGEVELEGPPT